MISRSPPRFVNLGLKHSASLMRLSVFGLVRLAENEPRFVDLGTDKKSSPKSKIFGSVLRKEKKSAVEIRNFDILSES